MDRGALLKRLKELWDTRSVLERNGPNSRPGTEWLAEVRANLQVADPDLTAEFAHYMSYVGLPLSSDTLGPIWINMQGILRTAIAKLEAELGSRQEKVYGPGDAFELYRDLSQLVSAAKREVFVADPYADEEVFELYLTKVSPGVGVRLLTKPPSSALSAVAAKFAARPGVKFEARSTTAIHDRVLHRCSVKAGVVID